MGNPTTPGAPTTRSNRLAIIGFVFMIGGPVVLLLAGALQNLTGNFSEIFANIIMWIALVLPGAGFVISIILLFFWKKVGNLGRALSIVTIVMCNPFFYYVYFIICAISGKNLAGLPWM